jgi:hypothetical protein
MLLMAAILISSHPALACGPFSMESIFTFTVHPEYPLEAFARGELGVTQPTYARSYLFVAYRYLNGVAFNSQEQQSLINLWRERLDYTWPEYDDEWPKTWLAARQKVPGIGAAPKLSVERHRDKPNEYETYINCQKDGFDTAAATLEDRIKVFGADSLGVKGWVNAQDQVFANCAEGQHIPAAAATEAPDLPPLIRADRAYQIAAATFYAGNFDEAQKLFTAISEDKDSPWHGTAEYLVARTLIRKSSLGDKDKRDAALGEAEAQLRKILKSASPPEAASRLLNLVRVRLHPLDKFHELAHSLLKKDQNETLKQDLWDYTTLFDGFAGDDEAGAAKEAPAGIADDDLTDWILTIQSAGVAATEHSLARFEQTHSQAWLVAALTKIDSHHGKATELIVAAAKIGPDSPAFASVTFQTIRLTIEAGKKDQARARLDDILGKYRSRLSASGVNLLLGQRLKLAVDLKEFLTFSQRVPAGFSWNDDGREIPAEASEVSDSVKNRQGQKEFDVDAADILNTKMPVAVLKQAALSDALPLALQRDVAQAAWIRAVILDDTKSASELVPTLQRLVPALKPLLDDYLRPQAPDAAKFAALYAWLKLPGVEPVVDSGVGRTGALNQQDEFRDNWWCTAAHTADSADEATTDTSEKKTVPPFTAKAEANPASFLTEPQRVTAAAEYKRLMAPGAAPNYLCRLIIAWATQHPIDPRVPEALHLAVKTTRYGCTDKESAKWSKAAFDLLHRNYPTSSWAKQTPYWFKD